MEAVELLLFFALFKGTVGFVQECEGKTNVHIAASKGLVNDLNDYLNENECSFMYDLDCRRYTPMHYAINAPINSRIAMLLLINCGFDVNRRFEKAAVDGTVLLHSLVTVSYEAVETLIEFGANISMRLKGGDTYLHASVQNKRVRAAKIFLENGIDPEALNDRNKTAMSYAVINDNPAMVNLLLKHDTNVNAVSDKGDSYLHAAVRLGNLEAARALLENGMAADIAKTMEWSNPETCTYIAAQKNNTEAMGLLYSYGADIQRRFLKTSMSLVHVAAVYQSYSVLDWLLMHDLDVNMIDINGYTPLHHAAYGGLVESVKFLVKRGACRQCKSTNGATPLDIAIQKGEKEVISFLSKL